MPDFFYRKTRAPPTPMHLVVTVGPFANLGIDFMTCNPHLDGGHGYIIVAVDYFTKWVKANPTFNNTGEMTTYLFFNHVITWFGISRAIVMDQGKHFQNHMMTKLTVNLGLSPETSTPYYPQENGQVEAINMVHKTMLQCIIGFHKLDWNLLLFAVL